MKNTTNASRPKPNGLRLYTSQAFKLSDEIRIFMSRFGKLMTGDHLVFNFGYYFSRTANSSSTCSLHDQ